MSGHVYIPELAARSVPRYTSYPTALEFAAVEPAEQREALDAIGADASASLYIHVPYCRDICWYCGCNTGAVGRADRLDDYVAALAAEIATTAAAYRGRIARVHFGGGSPNALSPAQFLAVADAVRAAFRIEADAEWAAELDPRLLSRDFAAALADAGITRASLGVQTFTPAIQQRINRVQPFPDVARRAAELRSAGIASINLDLMYGLPGQTLDDIAATIARARRLDPDRIAMFGYAHLPAAIPRQRMIDTAALPDARARFWQSALAHDLLAGAGFDTIGFDHFARPDDSLARAARAGALRRNFQGFTDDRSTAVIGIGTSSISQFAGLLVQNEKHVGRWRLRAANGLLAGTRGCRRTDEDRLRAAVIERLLCDGIADIAAIARRPAAAAPLLASAVDALAELEGHGIVRRDGWTIGIPERGRPYRRLVAAAFDGYRGGVRAGTGVAV